MQLLFLLTTALTVSIDSFLCGLSIETQYKGGYKMLLGITFAVFLVCLLGGFCGATLGEFFKNYSNLVGGIILYLVAVINSMPKREKPNKITPINLNVFKKSIMVGFGVGVDGALACFSLASTGYDALTVVSLITVMHLITLLFAIILVDKLKNKLSNYENLSPLILAFLGAFKTATFFK